MVDPERKCRLGYLYYHLALNKIMKFDRKKTRKQNQHFSYVLRASLVRKQFIVSILGQHHFVFTAYL